MSETLPTSTVTAESTKSIWARREDEVVPEVPAFEGFVLPNTELPAFDTREYESGLKPSLRNLAKRALSTIVRRPESSVGDVSRSLSDYGKLNDYRAGLDSLTDGGFNKTGRYDANREDILGKLVDEATIENELRDHANPHAEVQQRVLEATSDEESRKLSLEYAADGFRGQELGKLHRTVDQYGSDPDKFFANTASTEQGKRYIQSEEIRAKREALLQAALKKAEALTLVKTQDAARRGSRLY